MPCNTDNKVTGPVSLPSAPTQRDQKPNLMVFPAMRSKQESAGFYKHTVYTQGVPAKLNEHAFVSPTLRVGGEIHNAVFSKGRGR